jgi:hypothetical protein
VHCPDSKFARSYRLADSAIDKTVELVRAV